MYYLSLTKLLFALSTSVHKKKLIDVPFKRDKLLFQVYVLWFCLFHKFQISEFQMNHTYELRKKYLEFQLLFVQAVPCEVIYKKKGL
jgi:hypothetical protein